MPLPIKSRYTIAEAAKFIKSATGEAVTQAQILDWGTQGLYKLHIAIEHCNIRPIGETEIIQVRESITELRLNGGQAAILGRGERVGISACWHNGIACNFVRSSTYDSSWKPDTVYFGAAALVVIGAELAAFTASIAKPPQTAPATDTAPAQNTATPAPVAKPVKRKTNKPSLESVALDYMRHEYKSGQFKSAAVFHKHLIKTAGVKDSPFEMGTGTNARKLFCPAAGSFFDDGTLGKYWSKIRAA